MTTEELARHKTPKSKQNVDGGSMMRIVRPSSEGCCHYCGRSGKYLLDVNLNGNWWHFKCTETEKEAAKWVKWRSAKGAECRILLNSTN